MFHIKTIHIFPKNATSFEQFFRSMENSQVINMYIRGYAMIRTTELCHNLLILHGTIRNDTISCLSNVNNIATMIFIFAQWIK